MHIGIAGCGIGGLAIATLLAQQGHRVQLFDQFISPVPVGSGLVIQPVGQAVLHALGVKSAALAKGAPIREMIGHENKRGRRVLNVQYSRSNTALFGLGIHRASLFEVLYQAALKAGVDIIPESRVTGTALSKGKRLLELNAEVRTDLFDLVIDASGAGSILTPLKSSPLHYGAIWGTVDWPAETALRYDILSQQYQTAAVMIGVMPIGTLPGNTTRKAAVFWSLPQTKHKQWASAPLQKWKAQAINLWPAITPFLNDIHSHNDMTMARYSHGTLNKPVQECLAFIGDAAHCASPQLGQGANMALLDAFALAEAIGQLPLDSALLAYAKARRNHVKLYQFFSWALTPMYQSDSKILPFLRDWLLAPATFVPPVPWILGKLICGDLISPVKRVNLSGVDNGLRARDN
ncbi:FAD-dependent monooxygenase [Gammaproteobacteria bacterium]|nr:FAD-dependent monooxygenase [Gammaproteobacteria bacterium]